METKGKNPAVVSSSVGSSWSAKEVVGGKWWAPGPGLALPVCSAPTFPDGSPSVGQVPTGDVRSATARLVVTPKRLRFPRRCLLQLRRGWEMGTGRGRNATQAGSPQSKLKRTRERQDAGARVTLTARTAATLESRAAEQAR